MVAEPAAADDHRLVLAVRQGDDRAFEALYDRYRGRIAAYAAGMVKDHGRAEDVTQEVFVSALRRMRETKRPIAFRPWIYEIAKNACIDQYRRSRRAQEVSYDADDGLAPGDYGRLVGSEPTPDAAVAAKQDLHNLCGAFGGLSDSHHEILVLRELEGLSYREIGERMGLSRSAVESTLFRARRRLTEEYDELASGARCRRVGGLIATAVDGALGTRESRRLARHVSHCQPCRRLAIAAGLDSEMLTHVPLARRAAGRIAALLPIPWLARLGRGRDPAGEAGASLAQVPLFSDQVASGMGTLAAVAAVAVAGLGAAGVGNHVGAESDAPRRERVRAAPSADTTATATRRANRPAKKTSGAGRERSRRAATRGGFRRARGDVPRRTGTNAPAAAKDAPSASGDEAPRREGGGAGAGLPTAGAPAHNPAGPAVDGVKETADDTVRGAGETVDGAVEGAGDTADGAVEGVGETVGGAVEGAGGAVEGAGGAVGGAVPGAGGTVGGAVGGAGGAVGGAGQTVDGATQGVQGAVRGATGGLVPQP